jgi:hypothetical protein
MEEQERPKIVICERYHKCKNKENGEYPCDHGEEHEWTEDCFLWCEGHGRTKLDCVPIRALKLKQIKRVENDKRRKNICTQK